MLRLHGIDPVTLSLMPRLLIKTWACVVSAPTVPLWNRLNFLFGLASFCIRASLGSIQPFTRGSDGIDPKLDRSCNRSTEWDISSHDWDEKERSNETISSLTHIRKGEFVASIFLTSRSSWTHSGSLVWEYWASIRWFSLWSHRSGYDVGGEFRSANQDHQHGHCHANHSGWVLKCTKSFDAATVNAFLKEGDLENRNQFYLIVHKSPLPFHFQYLNQSS